MFTKEYWKELFRKQSIIEWVMVSIFLVGMVFFSIFDIKDGIVVSINWTKSPFSQIGQILVLIASFISTLVVMNRMHRMKQELPFLLLGSLLTGMGLLMIGYSGFSTGNTSSMGPGVVQMFVFGMSALSGLAKFQNIEENVIPAKKKLLSIELVIALSVVAITIFPFYMIFDKLSARSNVPGEAIDWVEWLGIIAFAFSSAAIVVMVLFRWTWTFIFWTIANIIFVIYYVLLKTQHGVPILSLVAISGLFTVIDFYILLRWIKDQKII
ncbi:hypothetical protein [Mycoplasma marinum]|uniref:Uncharacterized protein n=1 Tax=Mycoplasma marinum TaxID=1937190 RepID=A0A4R0XTG7_9MOLU|nr:hypothetical protein [Mycoplasma marinum]TCG11783.1 hypothetical protein C4B24_01370 [Mycoplasma marinum]